MDEQDLKHIGGAELHALWSIATKGDEALLEMAAACLSRIEGGREAVEAAITNSEMHFYDRCVGDEEREEAEAEIEPLRRLLDAMPDDG